MVANEMLGYIERRSPIHQLTGVTKLLSFILWSTAAMLTYDTRVLLFLLAASIVIFVFSDIKIKEVSFVLIFILVFLLINNLAIYVFSPQEGVKIYGSKHVLMGIYGRYNLTLEQLFYQFNITIKYFTVIPIAILFIVTTHPSEFAASLNRIGVSYRISYSVALSLRYIPDIQRDFRNIAISQQARGIDLSRKERLSKRVKNTVSIIVPLIFSSLDRIGVISNAMELRGFGKNNKRTWYSSRPFKKKDYIALILVSVTLIFTLIITFHDGNRFFNPFL